MPLSELPLPVAVRRGPSDFESDELALTFAGWQQQGRNGRPPSRRRSFQIQVRIIIGRSSKNPSASSLTKGSLNGKVGSLVVRWPVQSVVADPGVVKRGRSNLVGAVWVKYLLGFAGAHSPGCDRRADGQGQGVNLLTLVVEQARFFHERLDLMAGHGRRAAGGRPTS